MFYTEEIGKLTAEPVRTKVYSTLKALGFAYVTMDLSGYRTGSMNETLDASEKALATGKK